MFELKVYSEVDSTNSEGVRLLADGQVNSPTLIFTENQTAGRGTRGRQWVSGQSNLTASYIYPDTTQFPNITEIIYPVSCAVRAWVASVVDQKVEIKWPNDIMINGAKLSGALIEVEGQGCVIGVGMNVSHAPRSAGLMYETCCMKDFSDQGFENQRIAVALGEQISKYIELWKEGGLSSILPEYLVHAYRLNQEVRVQPRHKNAEAIIGIYKDVSPDGALKLETDGDIREITTADVFQL